MASDKASITGALADMAIADSGRAPAVPTPANIAVGDDRGAWDEPGRWVARGAALDGLIKLGPNAASAEPILWRVAQNNDEDKKLRAKALDALTGIHPDETRAVPATVAILKETVSRMFESPKSAQWGPENFDPGDQGIASSAARLLQLYGPKSKAAVVSLTRIMRPDISICRKSALKAIVAIGPDARSAVPRIEALLKNSGPYMLLDEDLEELRVALRTIDPEKYIHPAARHAEQKPENREVPK
jgi:hypothetical protein